MYEVIFKDVSCLDVGVLPVKRPGVPAPVIRQETYEIPGKDGILLSAIKSYEPIEIAVEFNFMAEDDKVGLAYRKFKNWLTGSGELRFSDDDDVFYMVYKAEVLDTERTSRRIQTATVNFLCEPFTYYNDGSKEQELTDCEYNPFDVCTPIYHVITGGTFTLTVNGEELTGTSPGELYIDTGKMVTYDGEGILRNTAISGDYEKLYLQEGDNDISCSVACKIIPRWRSV